MKESIENAYAHRLSQDMMNLSMRMDKCMDINYIMQQKVFTIPIKIKSYKFKRRK